MAIAPAQVHELVRQWCAEPAPAAA